MILPPLSVIMTWPTPNYINPAVIGNYLIPVLIVFIVSTSTIVALRLYSRACLLHSLSWDDWVIVPASLSAIALSVAGILTVTQGGWGRHIWDTPEALVEHARYYSFLSQIFFTMSVALTKVSILLFYLRFCKTTKTTYAIWTAMVFVVGWFIIWIITIFFQCAPVVAYWHWPKPGDRCTSHEDALHLIHGSTNLFSDVLVWALPIPTVLKLQLPIRQKLSLIGLFSLGLTAPLAGALRLVYIHKAVVGFDFTYYGYPLWALTSLEAHVGIICASAPSLKPLIINIFPRFGSTLGRSTVGGQVSLNHIATPQMHSESGKKHPRPLQSASEESLTQTEIEFQRAEAFDDLPHALSSKTAHLEKKSIMVRTDEGWTV